MYFNASEVNKNKESLKNVIIQRKLRIRDDKIQCGVQDGNLEQKRTLGKTSEIQIK